MSGELKICILSELAYSMLKGKGIRGGAELQMTLLARELKKRSYDISFVTFDNLSSSYEVIDDIKVYNPFYNQNSGYSYLYPQNIYKLLKILKKINADIYIQRASTPLTGLTAFFTKLKNRRFLYSTSCDNDVSNSLLINSINDLKKLIFRYGVKNCDMVICQTNHQRNLLKQTIGKEGKVIKNLYPFPKIVSKQRDSPIEKILWVGRIRKEKRPEMFLNLAKCFPYIRFTMLGIHSLTDPNYFYKIKKSANKISNLDFIGNAPHNKIQKYYTESMLLINTSPSEGFPNTFLEAWGSSIPIISLEFDPDEIICKNKLGFYSKTFEEMIGDVKTLLKYKKLRSEMGVNSRRYIEREHNTKKIIDEYEQLFDSLVT